MTPSHPTERGIGHLLDAETKRRLDSRLTFGFVEVFSTLDQLHDDVRELEESLSTLLYGDDCDPFPKRLLTRR